MDLNSKKILFKWGSVSMAAISIFMLLKCAFFKVSESLTAVLGIGSGLSGLLGGVGSDSLQQAVDSASNGSLTIFAFQKIVAALAEWVVALDDNGSSGATLFPGVLYWITVLLIISLAVEIVLHIFNSKFNCLAMVLDICFILIIIWFYYYIYQALYEKIGSAGISFTAYGIASMVLPIVSTVLWDKYYKIKDEATSDAVSVKAGNPSVNLGSFNSDSLSSLKSLWDASTQVEKILAIAIIAFYGIEILIWFGGGYPTENGILIFVEAVFIGFMVLCAYMDYNKLLVLFAVVSTLTKVIFVFNSLQYLYISYIIAGLGSCALTCLIIFLFCKYYRGAYSVVINLIITIVVKAFLFPLIVAGYFTYSSGYISVGDAIGASHGFAITVGIVLAYVVYMFREPIAMVFKGNGESLKGNRESYRGNGESFESTMNGITNRIPHSGKPEEEPKKKIYTEDKDNNREINNIEKQTEEKEMQNPETIFYIPEEFVICGACGGKNKKKAAFCVKCGNQLKKVETVKRCPDCGKEIDKDMLFCVYCGKKLTD